MIYTNDNTCIYRDGVAVFNISTQEEAARIVKLANIALTQEPDYSKIVATSMYNARPNYELAQDVINAYKEFQSRGL